MELWHAMRSPDRSRGEAMVCVYADSVRVDRHEAGCGGQYAAHQFLFVGGEGAESQRARMAADGAGYVSRSRGVWDDQAGAVDGYLYVVDVRRSMSTTSTSSRSTSTSNRIR